MEKKKINGWKLTAIISLIINCLVAILLAIGLGATPRSMTKVSAYGGYDNNKIITSTQKIDSELDYYLYFDWDNKRVEGTTDTYWFPSINNMPSFVDLFNGVHSLGSYDFYFKISHTSSNAPLYFSVDIYQSGSFIGGAFLYEVRNQIEPISCFLDKVVNSDKPYLESLDFYGYVRGLFDGTRLIKNSFSQYSSSYSFDLNVLYGYFSQYSVQSLSLKQEFNIQERINGVNFESEYSWRVQPQNQNYTFISNTLIVSKGSALFDTSITDYSDIGSMEALNGIIKVNDWCYSSLYWVWREVDFSTYANITYNSYMMSSLNGTNTNHYYYLDSLCPYDEANEEVLLDLPVVILHSDTYSYAETLGNPDNTLNLTLDSVFTRNAASILAIQLYPSQQVHFSNLGFLFKIVNNFYYYDGEIFIIDDSDGEISGNNSGSIGNVFVLITNAFESLTPIFGLMILPGITLGMLFFLPIVAIVIVAVIKIVKR